MSRSRKSNDIFTREKQVKVGTRVRHKIMGTGTVTDIDDKTGSYIIRFDELETERKIRFTAKLEVIG